MQILSTLNWPSTQDPILQEHYQQLTKKWAQAILKEPFAILDTETTGLEQPHLVELACIDQNGSVIIETLVHTEMPINPSAEALHGISRDHLALAPKAKEVITALVERLEGRPLLVYNSAFDLEAILNSIGLGYLQSTNPFLDKQVLESHLDFGWGKVHLICLMRYFAYFKGQWNSKGRPIYQKLGGGHRAKEDCQCALQRLREMTQNN